MNMEQDINFEFVPCHVNIKTEVIDGGVYDDSTVEVKVESSFISENKYTSCSGNEEYADTLLVNSVILKNEETKKDCYNFEKVKNGGFSDLKHEDDNSIELSNTEFSTSIQETEVSIANGKNNRDDYKMPKIFQCQRCKLNIGNEDFFKKHVLHCGRYSQDESPRKEINGSPDGKHKEDKSTEALHCCPQCNFTAKFKYFVAIHMNSKHTKKVVYKCDICSFSTCYKPSLSHHKRLHSDKALFICKICNTNFKRKDLLQGHFVKHRELQHECKFHKCSFCDYKSVRLAHVKRHENDKHLKIKEFFCDKFDYTATQKVRLKHHMYSHEAEKPNKCSFCDYQTANPNNLRVHLKRHKNVTGV